MSQPVNNMYSSYNTVGTPIYNYPQINNASVGAQQPAMVSPQVNGNSQVYQYPTSSIYEPARQASGVNIIINNPSGFSSGGVSNVPYPYPCPYPVVQNIQQPPAASSLNPQQAQTNAPVANTPISNDTETQKHDGKTKRITEITDDYVRNLESYLKSDSKDTRKLGITQLIRLCEESTDRYDNPALIALENIALQDPDRMNRIYAMTPLVTGTLGGDDNTIKLLQNLASLQKDAPQARTDFKRQQEAEMANEALLAVSRDTKEVPDYSQPKTKE